MFGMDALLSPDRIPAIAKALGITAARVDHDPSIGKLYLSWMRHGTVECIEIPCGTTFTPQQIAELLKHHDESSKLAPTGTNSAATPLTRSAEISPAPADTSP